jgi:hypothetical protein
MGGVCKRGDPLSKAVPINRGLDATDSKVHACMERSTLFLRSSLALFPRKHGIQEFLAVIVTGIHPFPFRTRPLSPSTPTILGAQAPGKIGRRQDVISERPPHQMMRGASPFITYCDPSIHVHSYAESPFQDMHP